MTTINISGTTYEIDETRADHRIAVDAMQLAREACIAAHADVMHIMHETPSRAGAARRARALAAARNRRADAEARWSLVLHDAAAILGNGR